MTTDTTYGQCATLESPTGPVAQQSGWARFDCATGKQLLKIRCDHGQLLLESVPDGAVRWSLVLRDRDSGDLLHATVRATESAQAGAGAMDGAPHLEVEVKKHASVERGAVLQLAVIELLQAAAEGREVVDVEAVLDR